MEELLTKLFPDSYQIEIKQNDVIAGIGKAQNRSFAFLGVCNAAQIDASMALLLSNFVLQMIQHHPGMSLILLIDTGGQKVCRTAEMLGLQHYYALLIKSLHYAKQCGHSIFSIVYGQALGGAFIATGLNANYIYALPNAHIAVMWLDALSRVIKIPIEKLKSLSATSPIFAPGVDSFVQLGSVELITDISQIIKKLDPAQHDQKHNAKNGRLLTEKIMRELCNAKL